MKKKVDKNPDSPLGRKDWEGRTPRWRPSWTLAKFMIVKEWADEYFLKHPGARINSDYGSLYEEIELIIQQMQTPLTSTVETFPLLDEDIQW